MNILFHFLIPILFLNSCFAQNSEQLMASDQKHLTDKISAINVQINSFYQNRSIDSLLGIYHPEITFCPEYKPAMFTKTRVKKFYSDWWQMNTINKYQKAMYEVQSFGEYILEDGHFTLDYLDEEGVSKQYDGMYFVMWKQAADGQLRILSEGFCSDTYRKSNEMPYATVEVVEQLDFPQHTVSKSLTDMIHEANDATIKAVETGDGEARINGFTEDAIYLHHFNHMMVDMDVIKPYLRKTYIPEAEIFVAHKLGRFYELGNGYVLIHAHYKGGWKMNGGGTFEGNFTNILREEKGNVLKTYRSWTNNDR